MGEKIALHRKFEEQEADAKRKSQAVNQRLEDEERELDQNERKLADKLQQVKNAERTEKMQMEGEIERVKAESATEEKQMITLKSKERDLQESAAAGTAQLIADSSKQKAADQENMELETQVAEADTQSQQLQTKQSM